MKLLIVAALMFLLGSYLVEKDGLKHLLYLTVMFCVIGILYLIFGE